MDSFHIPEAPEGMIFNSNMKIVNSVLESLATRTEGFCPCVPKHLRENEDYKCVCKEARANKICRCELFIQI